MKKIIAFLIAAAITIPILTGCGGSLEWDDTPLFEQKPVPVTIVEQKINQTDEVTAERFVFGDVVYSVCRSADGGDAYVVRYMVFAQSGELVAVVPMFNPSPEETREVLIDTAQMPLDGSGHLYLVTVDNCYQTQEEAQDAMDGDGHG